MKKILTLTILAGILFVAGCSPTTPQEQIARQQFWRDFSDAYQRELDRQSYGRQPVIITQPQKSNYWQELYYQQQLKKSQPQKKYNPYTGGYYDSNLKYNPYTGGYYR